MLWSIALFEKRNEKNVMKGAKVQKETDCLTSCIIKVLPAAIPPVPKPMTPRVAGTTTGAATKATVPTAAAFIQFLKQQNMPFNVNTPHAAVLEVVEKLRQGRIVKQKVLSFLQGPH